VAGSWSNLQVQGRKVRGALEKLTPPEPDDQFEAKRKDVLDKFTELEDYLSHKIASGGGE
jgi:hypothetical protein